jgi:hypothetical protein
LRWSVSEQEEEEEEEEEDDDDDESGEAEGGIISYRVGHMTGLCLVSSWSSMKCRLHPTDPPHLPGHPLPLVRIAASPLTPLSYVVLLYSQPSSFAAPANLSTANTPLGTFFLEEYVNSTGLGAVVAANYFQVENGVATTSVPATSTVNTATLSAASASTTGASASGSGAAASGSASKSGSATSGAAASSTSKAAAGMQASTNGLGWGVVVGAVGVVGCLFGAGLDL